MTVRIPVDAPTGPATLTLSLASGASASFAITLTQYAPVLISAVSGAFLSPTHPNGLLVTPAYPAAPGEAIAVAAMGLGPASIPLGTFTAAPSGATLAITPSVSLGGAPASVASASLIPGQYGIDQIVFTVPASTPAGTASLTLSIGGFTSNSLSLPVGPAPATPTITSVLDPVLSGATFCASALAVVSGINFGSNPQVTVAGEPAIVLTPPSGNNQILVQLPNDLNSSAPTSTVDLTVTAGGKTSAPVTLALQPAAPIIYSVEAGGALAPSHQNTGAPVTTTNPALPGESIVLFAINFGPVDSSGAISFPLSWFLQSQTPYTADSVSPVPGHPGLYQLIIHIPQGTPTGNPLFWIQLGSAGHGGQSNFIDLPTALTLATPSITSLANNYSYTVPGLPGYGIARGAIFDIFGSNLAGSRTGLLNVPLQTTVAGTSITITVNGVTTRAPIYFASPNQIAAILPSATPAGDGTLTVTTAAGSGSAPIHTVQSAFGILTLNGAGTGPAAALDINFNYLGFTNALNPGDYVILWGTGVGPAPGDETVTQSPANLDSVPFSVEIGGLPAQLVYHGRSTFPGLDQIVAIVPSGVTPGCWVSVVARSGGAGETVSNFATLPIAASGRTCSDPAMGLSATQIRTLLSQPSFTIGILDLQKQINMQFGAPGADNESDSATAAFLRLRTADFTTAALGPSIGSCLVTGAPTGSSSMWGVIPAAWLDAGASISISGAAGSATIQQQTNPGLYGTGNFGSFLNPAGLLAYQNNVGAYTGALDSAGSAPLIPDSGGGQFTFSNTSSGTDVPSFQASLFVPGTFPTWPQGKQLSQGAISLTSAPTLTWSNGDPDSFFLISGRAASTGSSPVIVEFTCATPASAGQFRIPDAVLRSLVSAPLNFANPAYVGVLQIAQASFARPINLPNIDFATIQLILSDTIVVSWR
jgi:uncharacterized protein (TIGR03437 family)